MLIKKRSDNLIPILIAIFALISLSLWYHYLGEYTIQKVDAALGVNDEPQIINLVIEKGYSDKSGLKAPDIIISYSTTKETASYIQVDDVTSDMTLGYDFSKTITLSRDYFGKTVELVIVAKDNQAQEVRLTREITIPNNIEPTIAIITT